MKAFPAVAALLLATLAGCSNIERSRNLANPAVPAKTIAQQVCANCHGMDGTPVSPMFPALAGQTKEYLAAQLHQFRDRTRADKAARQYMWGLTRSLTDEQIDGLAAYYAAGAPARARPVAVRLGGGPEEIYRNGLPARNIPACAICHGDGGEGIAQSPRVAAQHADYLYRQLLIYSATDERPDGQVMKAMLQDLGADELRDIAQYMQDMSPAASAPREAVAGGTPIMPGTELE